MTDIELELNERGELSEEDSQLISMAVAAHLNALAGIVPLRCQYSVVASLAISFLVNGSPDPVAVCKRFCGDITGGVGKAVMIGNVAGTA